MATSLPWTCYNCGNTDIQEIQTVTRIVPVEQVTEKYGVQLGTSFAYDVRSEISEYRCSNCYHCLRDDNGVLITTQDQLVELLK